MAREQIFDTAEVVGCFHRPRANSPSLGPKRRVPRSGASDPSAAARQTAALIQPHPPLSPGHRRPDGPVWLPAPSTRPAHPFLARREPPTALDSLKSSLGPGRHGLRSGDQSRSGAGKPLGGVACAFPIADTPVRARTRGGRVRRPITHAARIRGTFLADTCRARAERITVYFSAVLRHSCRILEERLVEHKEETPRNVLAAAGDRNDRSVDAAWSLTTRMRGNHAQAPRQVERSARHPA